MKEKAFLKLCRPFIKQVAEKYGFEIFQEFKGIDKLRICNEYYCAGIRFTARPYYDELRVSVTATVSRSWMMNTEIAFAEMSGLPYDSHYPLWSKNHIYVRNAYPPSLEKFKFEKSGQEIILKNEEDFDMFQDLMVHYVDSTLQLIEDTECFEKMLSRFGVDGIENCGGSDCANNVSKFLNITLWSQLLAFSLDKTLINSSTFFVHFPERGVEQSWGEANELSRSKFAYAEAMLYDRTVIAKLIEKAKENEPAPNYMPPPKKIKYPTGYLPSTMGWMIAIDQKMEQGINEMISQLGTEIDEEAEPAFAGKLYSSADGWYIGETKESTIIIGPKLPDAFDDNLDLNHMLNLESRLSSIFPQSEIIGFREDQSYLNAFYLIKNGKKVRSSYIALKEGEQIEHRGALFGEEKKVIVGLPQKLEVDRLRTLHLSRILGEVTPYCGTISSTEMTKIKDPTLSRSLDNHDNKLKESKIPIKNIVYPLFEYPVDEMGWMIIVDSKHKGGLRELISLLGAEVEETDEEVLAGEQYTETDGWYIGETDQSTIILSPGSEDAFAESLNLSRMTDLESKLIATFPDSDIFAFHEFKTYLNAFYLIRNGVKVRSSIQAITGPNDTLKEHNGQLTKAELDAIQELDQEQEVSKLIALHLTRVLGRSTAYCDPIANVQMIKMAM